MEAQTVLCCSRGLKEIHLLLLFTKFSSQLVAELLNATVLYEERGRAGGSRGERKGQGRHGNLSVHSQTITTCEAVPESFVSGTGV